MVRARTYLATDLDMVMRSYKLDLLASRRARHRRRQERASVGRRSTGARPSEGAVYFKKDERSLSKARRLLSKERRLFSACSFRVRLSPARRWAFVPGT